MTTPDLLIPPPELENRIAQLPPDEREFVAQFAAKSIREMFMFQSPQGRVRAWENALAENRNQKAERPSATGGALEGEWPEPIPLSDHGALPEFPIDVLPKWLGDFAEGIRLETQTPTALPGMVALAALSTASQGKFVVHVRGIWTEPLPIFSVTALEPSGLKSSVYKPFAVPIDEQEHEQRAAKKRIVEAAENDRKLLERDLKRIEGEAAEASGPDRATLVQEMNQLSARLSALPAATLPRITTANVTTEKLAAMMDDNDGRMAVLSAEGEVFKIMAGLYTGDRQPDFSLYLKAWSGETIRIDRKNAPEIIIHNPALTMGLMVQPHVIRSLKQNPAFRGEGLLSRFLYAIPKNTVGSRDMEPATVEQHIVNEYRWHMCVLFAIQPNEDPTGRRTAHVLELTRDSRAKFNAFRGGLEPRMGPGGDLEHIGDWCGKLPGQCLRLAGLLHLAGSTTTGPMPEPLVEEGTMLRAIRLCEDFFLPHALAAFGEMGASPEQSLANRAIGTIVRHAWREPFTRRELCKALNAPVADVMKALAALAENEIIRDLGKVKTGDNRPKGPFYLANPGIFEAAWAKELAR